MANEDKKDFNERMNNSKNMPKIIELDEEAAKKWGGKSMIIAPPIYYNEIIKKIPKGKLITTEQIRKYIAKQNNVDITCPLTAGIFINICAWASYQRTENITPYWRVLKSNGELNPKYPESFELQKRKLEEEGHTIISKGKTNLKYFVKDFEEKIFEL
ncbi:MAG: MGMT family protein [Clostridia bacterium]|nr:MGMT family protein [Clostridia bacterium]